MKKDSTNGAYLNDLWKVGVAHALYIHDGHWYHHLRRFPGALFDRNGYIKFATEEEYRACPLLSLGKQVSIKKPGISVMPGYVRVIAAEAGVPSPFAPPSLDIDIHAATSGVLEGRRRLVMHLERERKQAVVRTKKRTASSLACEICGFSFKATYGNDAAEYCEVHHLLPLTNNDDITKTSVDDLCIICANCHRVIHLNNPPYSLADVRSMIRRQQRQTP